MATHVCPTWVGYIFLLNPLRNWLENPQKLLGPLLSPGMTVLEPGPAMGFFTLPLARMVGPQGRVVAVDIQEKMLDRLRQRVAKAGLSDRVQTRLAGEGSLGVEDLGASVDLALAIHVVHEIPDQESFFRQIHQALRHGGCFLIVEPKGHVGAKDFARSLELAREVGFGEEAPPPWGRCRVALLSKA